MIIPQKKISVVHILSRMKDGMEKRMPVKPEVEMNPSDDDKPLMIAAQDIMQAFNDKSVISLCSSLCAFIDLYNGEEETTEDKEE